MSKTIICLSILPAPLEQSPSLPLNSISIWCFAWEAIWRGNSLWVQQPSFSFLLMNWTSCWPHKTICSCFCTAWLNLPSYEYVMVEKILAEVAIVRWQSTEIPLARRTLSMRVQLLLRSFLDHQLPQSSIALFRTSFLFQGNSTLHPLILVLSSRQAASASAEIFACANVPLWILCSPPSWVLQQWSACHVRYLHHPHHACPSHCPILHDHTNWLRYSSSRPQTFHCALWLSLWYCQHFLFLPAPAELLSLRLELAFMPQLSLGHHNLWFISLSLCCMETAFFILSPLRAAFWITSCAVPKGLGPFLIRSCSSHHLLDVVVGWNALLICRLYPPEAAKRSIWSITHCRLY